MNPRIKEIGQALILISAFTLGVKWIHSNAGQPPSSQSGSPGDGSNCSSCHAGTPASDSNNLNLSGLPSAYRPGTSYELTLTLNTGSKRGFEITAERTSNNAKAGTWTGGSNNTVISPGNWVGHLSASSNGSWIFSWTAPSAGSGNIGFYAAGNAANNNGSQSGDTIHLRTWQTVEAPSISSLSPNFGSVNETVTITGNAFGASGSSVSFNGTLGSWSAWSNTSITVKAPLGATVGNVTVINSTETSTGVSFNVITSSPVFTSMTPSVGSGTVNITNLTGNNFSPSLTLKLKRAGQTDITATGITVASSTSISATTFNLTGAATGFWDLLITNPDGQSTTSVNAFKIQQTPPAPSLSGIALSSTSIFWSWPSLTGLTSLEVRTSTGGILVTLAASATTWAEPDLTPETSYSRYVRSINEFGDSTSSTKTVTTPNQAATVNASTTTTAIASDNKTKVEVPAGALASNSAILISIDPENKPLAASTQTIPTANAALGSNSKLINGSIREIVAVVNNAVSTTSLATPATITLAYTDANNDGIVDSTDPEIKAANLTIHALNETSSRWDAVSGSIVDTTNKTVSASISHFSVYALMGAIPASNSISLAQLKAFPNPWRPDKRDAFDASGITFQNLTSEATIRIFTVVGELVRTINKTSSDGNQITWNGANDSGMAIASGIYLAHIKTNNGENKIIKIAIER